ncbi:MAG: hypothetical protein IJ600_04750 [Lachnospiraceae bacterium]|nr:hypothetical protein [Lachnospiraceae bacterium]
MSVLFSNFFSYDWIIFAMAVVNAIVFLVAWRKAHALYESVAPRINISSGNADRAIAQAQQNSTYFSLYDRWQKAEFFYTLFCNLTGVFTLLGILGTVISLLHLVDSGADLTGEFMGALTSTLWGIVFTIIFKLVDSVISFDLEMGERITELIQMREYENTKRSGGSLSAEVKKEGEELSALKGRHKEPANQTDNQVKRTEAEQTQAADEAKAEQAAEGEHEET